MGKYTRGYPIEGRWTDWKETGVQYLLSPERAQDDPPFDYTMVKLRKGDIFGRFALEDDYMDNLGLLEIIFDERVQDLLNAINQGIID